MRFKRPRTVAVGFWICLALILGAAGCTLHPAGERAERQSANQAGKPFTLPVGERTLPKLTADSSLDDWVQYALLNNADLERHYWEWRAAIEQIPQDGTQTTTLTFSAATTINKGRASLGNTAVGLLNDPMTDIHWPGTLAAATRRALENARAAGLRFRKAQFELRRAIWSAATDYAINVELIDLQESDIELLQTAASTAEARNLAGSGRQQDLLKIRNDLDLARNDLAAMRAQIPGQIAAIEVLLGGNTTTMLPSPPKPPSARPVLLTDPQLLELAARNNPELAALAAEIRARNEGIQIARLQYVPDFNLSFSTDLMGIAQNLAGSATIPLFRYEAINASIAQAEANLRAAAAGLRQTKGDLAAQVIADISMLRDADRQIALIEQTLLPRARQIADVMQTAYESAQATLPDLIESRRGLLSLQRLAVRLHAMREKQLADLEAVAAQDLTAP